MTRNAMHCISNAEQLVSTASKAGNHLGDVVFLRLWQATTGRTRLGHIAAQHSFPEQFLPNGLSNEAAFTTAMRSVNVDNGWLIRAVAKDKSTIVWQAVREAIDHDNERLDYPVGARLKLAFEKKTNRVMLEDPQHPVCVAVSREIVRLTDAVTTKMVRRMVKTVCREHNGIPIGTEWFVPGAHAELLRAMRGMVNSLGDSSMWLLPVFDSAESRDTLDHAVRSSIEDDLADLQIEIDDFHKKTRTGALNRRLEAFEAIRKKASLYAGMLSVAHDDLLAKVNRMEAHVAELIGMRA